MADEIVVKYKVDASEFGKVGVAVNTVTAETKELQNQIKATFADKSIEQATKDLYEQGDVMGALITKYGSATTALKAMEKELATMAALGQRGTESFNELASATAQLKDTIGDTRGEIKKMASDTKVFDTMVQGARGVAAAFSVATGVAAAFGSENENVQKALLKVQGAMAALQGVQELANIATEKGGIATKAYGVALQVVDKISKVTGLSMAASWALATAGVTVLIAGVISLISYFKEAEDASSDFAAAEKKRYEEYKNQEENRKEAIKIKVSIEKAALQEMDRTYEARRKQAILDNKDTAVVELGILTDKLKDTEELLASAREREKEGYDAGLIEYRKSLEDRVLETRVAYKKIFDAINTPQVSPTDNVTPMLTASPLVTDEVVDMNKRNIEKEIRDLRELGLKTAEQAEKESLARRKQQQDAYFAAIGQSLQAISTLVNGFYSAETQQLEYQKEEQLRIAGDDAKKREKIEKDFALSKAKIAREQAMANKSITITQIIISTAQAVVNALGSVPYSPANIALAASAGAFGAAQLAVAMATPIPPLPKFEKGGRVIAGGRNADGHLIGRSHRDGGILIEAQGQEYIWDRETTAKHGDIIEAAHKNRIEDLVFHKYVVPILKTKAAAQSSESYDDILLRKTVERTGKANARFIVDGISNNMKDIQYFANRYQ